MLGAASAVGALALACKALGLLAEGARRRALRRRVGGGRARPRLDAARVLLRRRGRPERAAARPTLRVRLLGREDDGGREERAGASGPDAPDVLNLSERDALATSVAAAAFCVGAVAFVAADAIARVTSPGLPSAMYATVAAQLRIMAPCIPLAAVNGVQMAKLTARRRLALPVASPAISSLCVIVVVAVATSDWGLSTRTHRRSCRCSSHGRATRSPRARLLGALAGARAHVVGVAAGPEHRGSRGRL